MIVVKAILAWQRSRYWVILTPILVVAVYVTGCGGNPEGNAEKRPRPVVATELRKSPPPDASLLTASAGSWKTEEIGFEVAGRVESVVEQNTTIEGRILDAAGETIVEGTKVARLESERFVLQVDRAKADVKRAEQDLIAAKAVLNDSIPAQIASAVATRTLAETQYARTVRLRAQNANTQEEVEQDKAELDTAIAKVKELEALEKSKEAEIVSLDNAVIQAKQSLRDAERDLEDCTLFSSFRGQVADVNVVPGSIVNAGDPVLTLQLMDPIKIELEVSAQQSRKLRRTNVYPVHVTRPNGDVEVHQGFLNQVDSVADPLLRTYTVTLLVINETLSGIDEPGVATTPDIWPLNLPFLPGASEGKLFVEEEAIQDDDQGAYLWLITNVTKLDRSPSDGLLEVRKIRIERRDFKAPYLGNWVFQEVVVNDPGFDPNINLVIGELTVAEGTAENWNGSRVYVDSGGRWLLRPGDLVKVDLSQGEYTDGYYVPLSAIVQTDSQAAIFVLEESSGKSVARRFPVRIVPPDQDSPNSSLAQIEALGEDSLEGLMCITEGSHYLIDGEPVNPISTGEGKQ